MKQTYIVAALALAFLAGCKSEKKDAQEQVKQMYQIERVDEKTGVQRMQVSRIQQEITCKGKKFKLSVERTPCDDLPQVKSDMACLSIIRLRFGLLARMEPPCSKRRSPRKILLPICRKSISRPLFSKAWCSTMYAPPKRKKSL